MSAETVRSIVIDKQTAPESLAQVDRLEVRPQEGLVIVSGEDERKVRNVGHFAADLALAAGFGHEDTPPAIPPELQGAVERVVEQRLQPISSQLETVIEQNRQLQDDNRRLNEKLQERDNLIAELRRQLDEKNGREPKVSRHPLAGAKITGASFPPASQPKERITVVEPEPNDPNKTETVISSEEKIKRAPVRIRPTLYERARARVAGRPAQERVYEVDSVGPYTVDSSGRRVYVEYQEDYRGRDRRSAAAAIGALAAVGALIFGIWNHHELEELEHRQAASAPSHATNYGGDNYFGSGGGYAITVPPETGRYNAYYNPSPKGRRTAIGLPSNLKIRYNASSESIVDKDSRVIVSRITWDRQGNLSTQTRQELTKNFRLTQGKLDDRYKTKVWNT